MSNDNTFEIVFGVFIAVLVIIFCGLYIKFAVYLGHGVDRWAADNEKAWQQERKDCKAKGGVPIQSGWDGRMKDCKL